MIAATAAPDERRARDLSLWYSRCPVPTATSVAIERGFLDREFGPDGICVRSLRDSSDPAVRLSHYTNEQAWMFREGGVVPPLWAVARQVRTRLIGLAWIDQFQGLIALRSAGIRSARDLRGRRVALPHRTGQPIDFPRAIHSYGIHHALAAAGMSEYDVDIVDTVTSEPFLTQEAALRTGSLYTARENTRAQTSELLALVRGEVDAIYTSGGYGREIAALIDAEPVIELPRRQPGAPWQGNHLRILTVSANLLESRPDLVSRYVTALARAAGWAASHADDALRIIAAEVGLSEEWTRLGYHGDLPGRLMLTASDDLLEALELRARFFYDRGFLEKRVEIGSWLAPDVLEDALKNGQVPIKPTELENI